MSQTKRTIKKPDEYVIPKACYPRKRKRPKRKIVIQQGTFISIPNPLKFLYASPVYPLYCDIALWEKDGTLIAQTTALNEIAWCRSIDVFNHKKYKMISIMLEKRNQTEDSPWHAMVEKLVQGETVEQREWGQMIEKFSLEYEHMLRSKSAKMVNVRGFTEEQLATIAYEGDRYINRMFEKYPCILFKSDLRGNYMTTGYINLNDKYLEELGFSLDSFTSMTLREGLPQMTPHGARTYEKLLVSNFFSVEKSFFETPEFHVEMNVKNGFVKKVKFKVVLVPRLDNKIFCLNTLIVLCGKDDKIKADEPVKICEINKMYLEEMIKKEKEGGEFLEKFYGKNELETKYSKIEKVCQVKEYIEEIEDEPEDTNASSSVYESKSEDF